ncbi:EamA family transporter [Eggerthellaceae bacterium zg-997]|nr:EamA family transporter [Eggerthellaceae bacterium zg-997]
MSTEAKGILFALAGAVLWGFSGACIQYLLADYELSPLLLTAVRMLGAGALFLVVMAVTERAVFRDFLSDPTALRQGIVFGAVGLFLTQLTYACCIQVTNSGTATVIASSSIVMIMVATCLLMRRLPRLCDLAGLVLAICATYLIATKGDPGVLSIPADGLAWGLVNAAFVSFYVMYPRKMIAKFGSVAVTGFGMVFGGVASLVLLAGLQAHIGMGGEFTLMSLAIPALDPTLAVGLALIVLLGTFGAFGLYLHGIGIIGGVKGSMIGAAEPVSATVIPAVFLGTAFAGADWVGLLMMMGTIALVSLPMHPRGLHRHRRKRA